MSHENTAPDQLKPVVEGLGWGGILPFLMLPLAAIFDAPQALETLLITYGLLILAFLCGTLWMAQILQAGASAWRILASNLIILAAWPAVLLPLYVAALLLAAGFTVHLFLDAPWRNQTFPAWYRTLRFRLSSVVTGLLLATALAGAMSEF